MFCLCFATSRAWSVAISPCRTRSTPECRSRRQKQKQNETGVSKSSSKAETKRNYAEKNPHQQKKQKIVGGACLFYLKIVRVIVPAVTGSRILLIYTYNKRQRETLDYSSTRVYSLLCVWYVLLCFWYVLL